MNKPVLKIEVTASAKAAAMVLLFGSTARLFSRRAE